ncbi:MAG: IPT/TIG domain-containing protein [Bacteroidales bacterium]|jgi:hypothetical protein|nr:IPT/TIG domain-containing protein [Bacteroidales bacterium]
MAIPTFTAITPNGGLTRGRNVVQITGSNFRLPGAPPPIGYLGGAEPVTVKVTFDGVRAPWAAAATSSLILATVPTWTDPAIALPRQATVRVANLDDMGAEIFHEHVTVLRAYTYRRPALDGSGHLTRVVESLINLFRIHVLENTVVVSGRDYSDDPAHVARAKAEAPVVYLVGPRMPINRFSTVNREDEARDPTDPRVWGRAPVPVTVDLGFDVNAWISGTRPALAMAAAIAEMFREITTVDVREDPNDPASPLHRHPFTMPWDRFPEVGTAPHPDDLRLISCGLLIKGVQLAGDFDTLVQYGWETETIGQETQTGP